MSSHTLIAALALFALAPTAARASETLDRGMEAMRAAVAGDLAMLDEAIDAFRDVLAADPANVLARAHLGEALVWKAIDVPLAQKPAQARAGFRELDAAVDMAPDDPEVRLIRAQNGTILPQVLGRHDIVAKDFAWLLAAARDPTRTLPDALRREIFYRAGTFALRERRNHEAAQLFREALAARGDEPTDERLQSMLALAQGPFTPLGHGNAEAQETPAAPGS